MKISELEDKQYLTSEEVANSYILVNVAQEASASQMSGRLSVGALADAIAAAKQFATVQEDNGSSTIHKTSLNNDGSYSHDPVADIPQAFDPLTYSIPVIDESRDVAAVIPFIVPDSSGAIAVYNSAGEWINTLPCPSQQVRLVGGMLTNIDDSINIVYLDDDHKIPVSNLPGEIVTYFNGEITTLNGDSVLPGEIVRYSNGEITTLNGDSVPVLPGEVVTFSNGEITTLNGDSVSVGTPDGTIVYDSSTGGFMALDGSTPEPIAILTENDGFLETGSESKSWTIPLDKVVIYDPSSGMLTTADGESVPVKFEEA